MKPIMLCNFTVNTCSFFVITIHCVTIVLTPSKVMSTKFAVTCI